MSDLFTRNAPLKIVTIKRTHRRSDGTFGIMDIEGEPCFLTVEDTWKDNKADSCIPDGEYVARRYRSPRFMTDVFEVLNVPNRSNIEIHTANTINDLSGCIGIGKEFGKLAELQAVKMSREAFFDFMGRFKNYDQFKLVVMNA